MRDMMGDIERDTKGSAWLYTGVEGGTSVLTAGVAEELAALTEEEHPVLADVWRNEADEVFDA